ncbi:MAG: aminotransferase class I/II-fold pyridoxal phosphate-dependent enzyme [Planctomycetes bacterium]|nr:aminotransferase class I/II-fold pyridoxal phosphate-dependent enzyme [Planctomycetota bacterium]MCB9917015.1 aminotransferase class I/II-fold pyridoxal phosphate-dependent enzyme [Planctomycetota bacterium]
MDRILDFRSDTVTKPDEAMRAAMASAVVGDDVLGDDPTVRELENAFANKLGKESALYCPSGSMCNLIAVCVWTRPGDEIVMEERTHTFQYEGGSASRFGHVQTRTFARESGIPEVSDLTASLRNPHDVHHPRSSLFVVENTHNAAGGRIVPKSRIEELATTAHAHGLRMHIDGARLFNASVATGVSVADIVAPADSVMCCLSKGLGAPIGSCLAGPAEFIVEARRVRKALGGGMRQVGILAAAGLLALTEGPDRLATDHERARSFQRGLVSIDGLDADPPETNMVRVKLDESIDAAAFVEALRARGLLVFAVSPRHLRFVFHRDQRDEDVERALAILTSLRCP